MSPLAWFVCVLVGSIGYGVGVYRYNRHGEAQRAEGRADAIGQAIHRVERRGMMFGLSPNGRAAWFDAGSEWAMRAAEGVDFDGKPVRAVRQADDPPRPDDDLDHRAVGRVAAGALPPGMPVAGAGGPAPVDERYDLDHPAPPGFYPELAALADLPRPGSVCEPTSTGQLAGPGEPDPVFGCLDDDGAFALIRWELGRLAWLAGEPFTLTPWRVPELAGTA